MTQTAWCQNITSDNYRLKECPAGGRSGVVGKRPRKTRAGCIHHISPTTPSLGTVWLRCSAFLHCAVLSVRICAVREDFDAAARRHLRLRRLFSKHLPVKPPAGYKAFSNQRQLLSDQDCFSANVIRLEASTMALLRIIGECSVKCSVIKISDDDISGNTRKVSITAITSTSSRKNAKLIYWYIKKWQKCKWLRKTTGG